MKKTILYVLIALMFFGSVSTSADTSTQINNNAATTSNSGFIQKIKNTIENRVASSTTRIVKRRFETMTDRYQRTIEREENIVTRIESRIIKIKLANGTTTDAERYVADAKIQLADARTDYETLRITATSADNLATTTNAILKDMQNTVKLIDKHLRDAHKLLQKTVGSLRGVSQLQNATSTKIN